MPYYYQINFDNSKRLDRNALLFEYKNAKFKLIQNNPRKSADSLMTVLLNGNIVERERIFSLASEFLSALSWENNSRIMVWESGGKFLKIDEKLSAVKPLKPSYPKIQYGGNIIGHNIAKIPKIETKEHLIALSLMREAKASNNDYLSFMFYWQILDIGGTKASDYANKVYEENRKIRSLCQSDIVGINLGNKKLGEYLEDDCRHAIAHIIRKPGKRKLDLNLLTEKNRISKSVSVIEKISRDYIENNLKLEKKMYLVRKTKRGCPVYVDEEYIKKNNFYDAYKS